MEKRNGKKKTNQRQLAACAKHADSWVFYLFIVFHSHRVRSAAQQQKAERWQLSGQRQT
jgi:hypothetical protein